MITEQRYDDVKDFNLTTVNYFQSSTMARNNTKGNARQGDPGWVVNLVYENGDGGDDHEMGFAYSMSTTPRSADKGQAEFICLDVPRDKATRVGNCISYLYRRNVKNGERVQSGGLWFHTQLIEGPRKQQLIRTHLTHGHAACKPLFALLPAFEDNPIENWGCLPPAPEGNDAMVQSILDVWKSQGSFVLYIDGDTTHISIHNLKYVDLTVALRRMNEWKVNWDFNLNDGQKSFVRQHTLYFTHVTRTIFRKVMCCEVCGEMEGVKVCSRCKNCWYCCPEHQREHWPEHKTDCKRDKAMRNNKAMDPRRA